MRETENAQGQKANVYTVAKLSMWLATLGVCSFLTPFLIPIGKWVAVVMTVAAGSILGLLGLRIKRSEGLLKALAFGITGIVIMTAGWMLGVYFYIRC